ncbi:rhodanese-like domain-containing protein [Luteolibacter sp. SL250]|uniref:rhodanese-like domain-containing protein n=1 Tax=Luteolibacter sp. SL250 TaxID=2995170 RepID=UPI00226D720B|nr:rhodanese-like domain-containing protein [Luteolibacter sp. SL250]WAC17765.1 rhodanese-like domain-containing protein [Luteolibacter sp. SL250]
MTTITPTALRELLTADPSAELIDVRTPLEFREVHAQGAKNLPLDTLDPSSLPDGKPIYLLCRSGQRATRAAEKFSSSQLPVVVEGGTLAWVEAGLPVVRSEKKVIGLERQVRIAAGSLVLTGFLLGWFVNPHFFFLSGFVGAGLVFAGITDWCGMGLLLAKAPWNR